MTIRKARIKLIYDGTDISQDIAPDLVSFDYSDKESNEADDISVKLKNNHGRWTSSWFPSKGDTLTATIISDGQGELYCGTFKIDELEGSFLPSTLTIKGVSIPIDETIRRKAVSKTWEDVKLSGIVNEVASQAGLKVIYDVAKDPSYDRVSQREESNLAFLERMCKAEGYSVKVTDEQLVVFDQAEYESKPTVFTIELGKTNIVGSPRFKSQAFDLYKSCTGSYLDPEKQEYLEATFEAPNVSDGMECRIVKRAGSLGELKRWAKAELRKRNKHEVTADITLLGEVTLIGGVTVDVVGFGQYDGKYMVEKAGHSVNNGYTTPLSLRRVLEGY